MGDLIANKARFAGVIGERVTRGTRADDVVR